MTLLGHLFELGLLARHVLLVEVVLPLVVGARATVGAAAPANALDKLGYAIALMRDLAAGERIVEYPVLDEAPDAEELLAEQVQVAAIVLGHLGLRAAIRTDP